MGLVLGCVPSLVGLVMFVLPDKSLVFVLLLALGVLEYPEVIGDLKEVVQPLLDGCAQGGGFLHQHLLSEVPRRGRFHRIRRFGFGFIVEFKLSWVDTIRPQPLPLLYLQCFHKISV